MNEALQRLNGILEKGFTEVLLLSLMASVLALVILLLRALLRKGLRPGWVYVLWLPLLLRLVIPWSPESSFSLYGWLPQSWSLMQQQTDQTAADQNAPNLSDDALRRLAVNADKAQAETSTQPIAQSDGMQQTQIDLLPSAALTKPQNGEASEYSGWLTAAAWIWLVGIVALLGMAARSGVRFDRHIRRDRAAEISNGPQYERIRHQSEQCRAELGVRRAPRLIVTDSVTVPTVFGALRPLLLIPTGLADTLQEQRLRHILLHELAHIKRRDIAVNLLTFVLTCIHWFNPLLAWAFRKLREDQEIACDELALGRLSPDERKEYGLTLIALLERSLAPKRLPAASGMWSGRRERKRRMSLIAGYRKNTGISLVAGMVALLVLAGCALSGPPDQSPDSGGTTVVSNSESDADSSSDGNAGESAPSAVPANAVIPSTKIEVPAEGEEGYTLSVLDADVSVYVKQADDPAQSDTPQGRFTLRKKDGTASAYLWNYDSRNGTRSVLISETEKSADGRTNLLLIVPTSNAEADNIQEVHVLDAQTLENIPVEEPLAYVKQRLHSSISRQSENNVANLEFEGIHITKVYESPDESALWNQEQFASDVRYAFNDNRLVAVLDDRSDRPRFPFSIVVHYASDFSIASTTVYADGGPSYSEEELPRLVAQKLGTDPIEVSDDWALRKKGDIYTVVTNSYYSADDDGISYGINRITGTLFDPTSGAPIATLNDFSKDQIKPDLAGLMSSDGSIYRSKLEWRIQELADNAGWTLNGEDWIEGFSGDGNVVCRIVFEGRDMTVKADVFTGMWWESE